MEFELDEAGRVLFRRGDQVLAEYVFQPTEPQLESPRPYALLRTPGGVDVTAYRPDDHVWHKGLSLALPSVGPHNFWGGPTYVHDQGYVQLPNNGAQVHRSFERAMAAPGSQSCRIEEGLDWIAEDGTPVLDERRILIAQTLDDDTWALSWHSALRNVTDQTLGFGSPTSKGRPNAGYAGIFWRGPVGFTGGRIFSPEGLVGDAARGEPGPWLAYVAPDRSAGVLMFDGSETQNPWFARSEEYAGLNPAPFFFEETSLPPEETLVLSAALVIGTADVADVAADVDEQLLSELRALSPEAL